MMIMSGPYLSAITAQSGRPYVELMSATDSIPAHHIVGIHAESQAWPRTVQTTTLEPPQLRKAFLSKPHLYHNSMGHMEVFDECLCRIIGVRSVSGANACHPEASLGISMGCKSR